MSDDDGGEFRFSGSEISKNQTDSDDEKQVVGRKIWRIVPYL